MGSVPSTLGEPQITIDKIIGVDPLSPAQLEALSNLDNFSFDDGSIQNLSMKASYLTINYSAMLKKSASTPEEMRKLVMRASVSNSQRKISGKICLRNPFEENFFVTQTIEGPVATVAILWNRIKSDPRIQEIVDSSYSIKNERSFRSWGLALEANERDWGRNFMTEHCKHRILHHNNAKTVYIAEDMRTNRHYVMKEMLVISNIHDIPESNEHSILTKVHEGLDASLEGRTGVIGVPDIFHELVKISMVYPLYPMDLFNAINFNTDMFKNEGFDEKIIVTFIAQLFEALLILKKRRVVHRDIKPENICVDENGNLVLMDFELAVQAEDCGFHKQDVLVGTTLYIAPEAYRRLEYSSASDMWAVAIIACELHSTELPWKINENMTVEEVGRTILKNPPKKPSAISDTLWALLSKIFVRSEDRISLEEAIKDPIFGSYKFIMHGEDGTMIPGNVFDRHDHLEPLRKISREHGLLSANAELSSRDRFNRVQKLNTSPNIRNHRNVYVENMSSPKSSLYGKQQQVIDDE
ncbi:hypothetical protein TrST_g2855 [Triparma strigata]|uniref:Protein kinase domain-containing protein n=1 Tax=Triparma strigata TaxID=1606541 RepID=A0A9W6ZRD6_9STRA|nr:hypothetical protein TrST_g2855 [Triparma strigata]